VALYLVGSFAEDISMYRQRNPRYNLRNLVDHMMEMDFTKCMMASYLKGRTLWCAAHLAEIMPRDYEETHLKILNYAIQFMMDEKIASVKLVATRCLTKFSRKLKNDVVMKTVGHQFESILDELSGLLDNISQEVIQLPIEAFTQFSKLDQGIVAQMAPKVTNKLLRFFKTYQSESNICLELLNLFKIWTNYDTCRDIFANTFIPFIMEIIDNYYQATPNIDNKDSILVAQAHSELEDRMLVDKK
jgi:hypothetical protein